MKLHLFVPAAGVLWAALLPGHQGPASHGHQLLWSPGCWRLGWGGGVAGWAGGLWAKGFFICVTCADAGRLAGRPVLRAGQDLQGLLTEMGGALLTAV